MVYSSYTHLLQPADWVPIVSGADLSDSFKGTYRDLFQNEIGQHALPGTYTLVFLAVRSGSLADNLLDPTDIVGVTWAYFDI